MEPQQNVPSPLPVSFTRPPAPPTPTIPPAPPIPPIVPRMTAEPQPRHSGWLKALVIMAVIVIVLAGAAYAAYALVLSPERALPQAFSSAAAESRIHTDVKVSVDSGNRQVSGSSLSISADTDRTKPSDTLAQMEISLASPSFAASAEMRLVGDTLYGRITDVPAQYATMLASVTDKWFSISLSSMQALAAQAYHASTTSPFSPAPSSRYGYDKLVSAGVVTDQKFLGIGAENGSLVRRYQFSINKASLALLVASEMQDMQSSEPSSLTPSQSMQVFDAVTFSPVIVAVDFVSGALESVSEDVSIADTAATASIGATTVHIAVAYSGMPASTVIAAPTGATAIDSYLTASLNSATRGKGQDASIQADVEQVRSSIESVWEPVNGYAGLCSKGYAIGALKADLLSNGSALICHDSHSAYAAAAKLNATLTAVNTNQTIPQYFCLDSTGKTATLSNPPAGTACK